MNEENEKLRQHIKKLKREIKSLTIQLDVIGNDYRRMIELSKSLISTLKIEEVIYNLLVFLSKVLNFDTGYYGMESKEGDIEIIKFRIVQGEVFLEQKGLQKKYKDNILLETYKEDVVSLLGNGDKLISVRSMKNNSRAIIVIESFLEGVFTDNELRLFSDLVEYSYIAVENAVLFNQINEYATIDGLTEIYNRRYFLEIAAYTELKVKRSGSIYSIAILDIDFFKNVNDNYGHQLGDKVLQQIARCIKSVIRDSDVFARYGGEEFIIMFVDSSVDYTKLVAEKIRCAIELDKMEGVNVTISIGICDSTFDDGKLERVISKADKALYEAKAKGRNCVVVYGGDEN